MKRTSLILRFLLRGALLCSVNFLKNAVQSRAPANNSSRERCRFLRQSILHLTGLRRIRKITCTGLSREGPGSQALMKMNAMNFARASGLAYLHTPFVRIQNPQGPMPQWIAAWEALFNLGAGEVPCPPDATDAIDYCLNHRALELIFSWTGRRHELRQSFHDLIQEFRRRFYRGERRPVTAEIRVAVNIRRGEVSSVSNRGHFTRTEKIRRTATAVKSVLDSLGAPYRIDIYSNGQAAEFADFAAIGARIFTNPEFDAAWTMRQLVDSDVLVMAKSTFSSYAALLSGGIRIYEPRPLGHSLPGFVFDTPVTEDWLPCLEDGTFDEDALKRRLRFRIGLNPVTL